MRLIRWSTMRQLGSLRFHCQQASLVQPPPIFATFLSTGCPSFCLSMTLILRITEGAYPSRRSSPDAYPCWV